MYVDDPRTKMKFLVFVLSCIAAAKAAIDTDTTCERRWKKIGCFHDYVKPERPLKLELLNRRDPINHNFDNKLIDWKDYPATLRALYCKCARLTEERGYKVFGLQFYGECWSGTSGEERYAMQGKSDRCIGVDYKPCDDKAVTECIGKDRTNYIYQLVQNNSKTTTDGGYTDWEDWSECSKSCGGGFRFRSRSCTNPTPSGGGKDCSSLGESEEMEKCNDKPCKNSCKKAIDLGIIMDASSSVKRKNYNKVKSFIKDLSDDFTISASETRFGIIHYSSYARLDFTPRNTIYHDRIKLKAKIDSIVYSYGGTRTDKALRLAEREFFCPGCNPTGKPKVLLVITDGNTNPGSEDLAVATKNMKDNGVNILSLGIGPKISEAELKIIASKPKDKHVFKINSFDDLKAALNRILSSACEATR